MSLVIFFINLVCIYYFFMEIVRNKMKNFSIIKFIIVRKFKVKF